MDVEEKAAATMAAALCIRKIQWVALVPLVTKCLKIAQRKHELQHGGSHFQKVLCFAAPRDNTKREIDVEHPVKGSRS